MSKLIYDVIQRFEVEQGVPRLVSTNIQVIQGGEDLLSLATSLLAKLGFYEKFEENRTSQYIGFRLKNPAKGTKRYQLVLSQRKEGLYISLPDSILYRHLVWRYVETDETQFFWLRPSKKERMEELQKIYTSVELSQYFVTVKKNLSNDNDLINSEYEEYVAHIKNEECFIEAYRDTLFPYAFQVFITSSEVLNEFIAYFAKILMEQ